MIPSALHLFRLRSRSHLRNTAQDALYDGQAKRCDTRLSMNYSHHRNKKARKRFALVPVVTNTSKVGARCKPLRLKRVIGLVCLRSGNRRRWTNSDKIYLRNACRIYFNRYYVTILQCAGGFTRYPVLIMCKLREARSLEANS